MWEVFKEARDFESGSLRETPIFKPEFLSEKKLFLRGTGGSETSHNQRNMPYSGN